MYTHFALCSLNEKSIIEVEKSRRYFELKTFYIVIAAITRILLRTTSKVFTKTHQSIFREKERRRD